MSLETLKLLTFEAMTKINKINIKDDVSMKGQATGRKPRLPVEVKRCRELYEVFNIRASSSKALPILDSPNTIANYLNEFFTWCEANPFVGVEYVKSGMAAGTSYAISRRRPKTLRGFCLFLGRSVRWFEGTVSFWEKTAKDFPNDEGAKSMCEAFEAVRSNIDEDCDAGALSGFFDSNYMAKMRGLREIKDVTSKGAALQQGISVNVLTPDAIEKINKLASL